VRRRVDSALYTEALHVVWFDDEGEIIEWSELPVQLTTTAINPKESAEKLRRLMENLCEAFEHPVIHIQERVVTLEQLRENEQEYVELDFPPSA
jgi:hypothetical protein